MVQAYDPAANAPAEELLHHDNFHVTANAYQAAAGTEAVAVLTEWNEFRNLDLKELRKVMAGDVLLDSRNVFEPDAAVAVGFVYLGRGRSPRAASESAPKKAGKARK